MGYSLQGCKELDITEHTHAQHLFLIFPVTQRMQFCPCKLVSAFLFNMILK